MGMLRTSVLLSELSNGFVGTNQRTWDIALRLRSSASFSHANTSLRPMVFRWMGLSRRLAPQEYALCPDAVLPTDLARTPPSCSNNRYKAHRMSTVRRMMGPRWHVHGVDMAEASLSDRRWPGAANIATNSHTTAFWRKGIRSADQFRHGKMPPSV